VIKVKVKDLPLSTTHSKGFGFKDYFMKNKHGKKIFEVMKVLALNGSMTKYSMSCLSRRERLSYGIIQLPQRTKFAWIQVHRYFERLEKNGLVKRFGIQRITEELRLEGKKHEVTLYGLTNMGIILACLVDNVIFLEKNAIIRHYSKFEKGTQKGWLFPPLDKDKSLVYEVEEHWLGIEMLLNILCFTEENIPELPKTSAIFRPENLDAIRLSTPSVDLRPFSHFFDTLSDEIAGIVHKTDKDFSNVIKHLNKYELLEPLLEYTVYRKNKYELHLKFMEEAIHKLSQKLEEGRVREYT